MFVRFFQLTAVALGTVATQHFIKTQERKQQEAFNQLPQEGQDKIKAREAYLREKDSSYGCPTGYLGGYVDRIAADRYNSDPQAQIQAKFRYHMRQQQQQKKQAAETASSAPSQKNHP